MKLIIQIPCFNEQDSLPISLKELPKSIPGIDTIEWLIINDGSSDNTVQIAKEHGVHHVVDFPVNRGLAAAFVAGIQRCVQEGADIIVNTDADNQYCADDIEKLVRPVLEKRADYVIGTRPIAKTEHFSPAKKFLQKLGSWVVRKVSKSDVPDAPSGFRALSREAAMKINVFTGYTYTIETIIQAGLQGFALESVPIRTNEDLRPSRLLKSIRSYIQKSIMTMLRVFIIYQPIQFFGVPGLISLGVGSVIGLRYVYFVLVGEGGGHIQSLILSSILIGAGISLVLISFVSDLIAVNRKLLEKVDWRIQQLDQRLTEMESRR